MLAFLGDVSTGASECGRRGVLNIRVFSRSPVRDLQLLMVDVMQPHSEIRSATCGNYCLRPSLHELVGTSALRTDSNWHAARSNDPRRGDRWSEDGEARA